MMQNRSPPKHRHDGISPLPLGMDWSPPPRKWNGKNTVWPHDHHTGWSYCVIIPSWVALPKSRVADPVVFYRVQVGVQSPEGITAMRGVLRRFNDFLNLFSDVKKAFPKKTIPPAPSKGILRVKTRTLLEERRRSLEEWLTKLLSDIDISRSAAVASFLELEAAARSFFQNDNQGPSDENPDYNSKISTHQSPPNSSSSTVAGGLSLASDYGSDTAYEASELGTASLGRDDNSEIAMDDLALDDDLSSPIEKLVKYGLSNIDEGLFMGQAIIEQLEGLPKHKSRPGYNSNLKDGHNGSTSKASYLNKNGLVPFADPEHGKVIGHARKLSDESVASDASSSLRGGEISSFSPLGNGSLDHSGAEVSNAVEFLSNPELHFSHDALLFPKDHRHKLNRVLSTMHQRLVTAKTDMEDLISRLNQEIAVKDYLTTMVKDLEVELETNKQKSKENLQQAILMEREKVTQMQWEMEELRHKSLEMELKLKSKEGEDPLSVPTKEFTLQEKVALQEELESTKEQLNNVLKRFEELEGKSKADIRVLVKEVKSLRSTQAKLKQELSQTLQQKSETEEFLQQEREMRQHDNTAWRKLLSECRSLRDRLKECSMNFSADDDYNHDVESSALSNALDLLTTSYDQLNLLLTEENLLLAGNKTATSMADDDVQDRHNSSIEIDTELRMILKDMFTENARLRKQVNSYYRHSMQSKMSKEADGAEASSSSEHTEVHTSTET
ncbi:PX domain-containing protein EREL2-like isoform X1 [Cucurbita moschata]|uniref:PX domain-containing protein EREL2-like isoform X1 n=2 Tax=Cucurbita moschata TaxID=3662 RepID=A0A6J1FEJ7_CUCMO|nr:PX domain-containing protein EREL2-like isoform X1 [Cucurbita moschata]